ncbi:hypothetical protein NLJ89_g7935 [Agrocybe chaxingu]|uniref:Uncharacterized protein n=1 Tax=Agrocybe chaxingu TaxID=84603 RepID=A0A9W8JYA9_9AGAR|nr:hypothetical protein NLJ89_g7935 [Agrocybe chaxingu]
MYAALRSSAYFFVRILRAVTPAPERSDDWDAEIPPFSSKTNDSHQQLISTWHWYVGGSYSSPTDLQNTIVVRIQWFKNSGGLEHEFLVVTVKRQGGLVATLRIERRPSHDQIVSETFAVSSEVLEVAYTLLSDDVEEERVMVRRATRMKVPKLHDKRQDLQANDTIIHVRNEAGQVGGCKEPASLIASFGGFQKPLLLRDFVFAAYQASSFMDGDFALLKQAFWFPRTVVAAIIQNYLPQEVQYGEAFERRGCYCLKKDTERPSFILNADSSEEIDEISRRLLQDIENNDKHIQKKYMAGPGGKVLEQRRADEEQQRRIAAEHAASHAREEASALAEQNKQLEEEVKRLRVAAKI